MRLSIVSLKHNYDIYLFVHQSDFELIKNNLLFEELLVGIELILKNKKKKQMFYTKMQ